MKIKAENARQYLNHVNTLAQIAGVESYEASKIYESLCRLEANVNRITTAECNGTIDPDRAESLLNRIEMAVKKLLPNIQGFFINGDPRGYSLKVKENTYPEMYQDWGGYGILAPEF